MLPKGVELGCGRVCLRAGQPVAVQGGIDWAGVGFRFFDFLRMYVFAMFFFDTGADVVGQDWNGVTDYGFRVSAFIPFGSVVRTKVPYLPVSVHFTIGQP